MWLIASAEHVDVKALEPALARELRRFNAPVQLAVAAARTVAARATAPSEAAIIALAPCQAGSPELARWVSAIEAGETVKMNPTHTLHAVDNLALSVLSIALGQRGWGMSLGGAAGMVWAALELASERLAEEREVIVVAGDQDRDHAAPVGVALLFARERAPHTAWGRALRLVAIERRREAAAVVPHAAAGAREMLAALHAQGPGQFAYRVPASASDGVDAITIAWEIS